MGNIVGNAKLAVEKKYIYSMFVKKKKKKKMMLEKKVVQKI